jgi:hypothetical protein
VPLADDLELIESSIRRLQVEWEKFFGGVEKKPPNEMKTKLEALLRRYANAEVRNSTERFRYQTLTARYNTFNELWAKRLRAKEEGKVLGVHGLKADQLPPPPPQAEEPPARPAARPAGDAREVRVSNPARDAAAVRQLYDGFVKARMLAGETGAVKFDSFQKLIAQQATRILTDKGASAVDFRLETKDGKVTLKAKVVK